MSLSPVTPLSLGASLPSFRLPEPLTGRLVGPEDFPEASAVLVAFIANACPEVARLAPALSSLALKFLPRGLQILAVNAFDDREQPDEAPAAVAAEALKRGYVFPYLIDQMRSVAQAFGAVRAPDFYLFDSERRLYYHGRFDATRFGDRSAPDGGDLRRAVAAALGDAPRPDHQVASPGCPIR